MVRRWRKERMERDREGGGRKRVWERWWMFGRPSTLNSKNLVQAIFRGKGYFLARQVGAAVFYSFAVVADSVSRSRLVANPRASPFIMPLDGEDRGQKGYDTKGARRRKIQSGSWPSSGHIQPWERVDTYRTQNEDYSSRNLDHFFSQVKLTLFLQSVRTWSNILYHLECSSDCK